jgi:hypothetical protein
MIKQKEFYQSILDNNIDIFKLLIKDRDVDPSKDDNWAIFNAIEYGYIDIVKLLLNDKRVNPNNSFKEHGNTIRQAAEYNHIKIVELLLMDKRADPSLHGNIAIISASDEKIIKLLLNDDRVKKTLTDCDLNLCNEIILKNIKNKVNIF